MIGRVRKNPTTGENYAETLAGPTGGTVQKLGLNDDCDYEVVLSAGDRDVDGESYVGVSTACPVTYNPDTGVFKVCTLVAESVNGNIDADRVRTCCYMEYTTRKNFIPAVTCTTMVDGKEYSCLQYDDCLYFCNTDHSLHSSSVVVTDYTSYTHVSRSDSFKFGNEMQSGSISQVSVVYCNPNSGIVSRPFIFTCCGLETCNARICNVLYTHLICNNGPTAIICVSNACIPNSQYTGMEVDAGFRSSTWVSASYYMFGACIDSTGRVNGCNAVMRANDYSYNCSDLFDNDINFSVKIGQWQNIIFLCGNCYDEADWWYNVGPNNGHFTVSNSGSTCNSACREMFIGAYNLICSVNEEAGRQTIMLGFHNRLSSTCDIVSNGIIAGWGNNIGYRLMENQSVLLRGICETTVLGNLNCTTTSVICSTIIGTRNHIDVDNAVLDHGTIIGTRNCIISGSGKTDFVTAVGHCNCIQACCTAQIVIGSQNRICGNCSIVIGCGSCSFAPGTVTIGHNAGRGIYNITTLCANIMCFGTYIGKGTGMYSYCGVCFDTYQHLAGRAWKVRVSIAQGTIHCNFNKAWHCYIRNFANNVDPSGGYNHTYRFVGYGAEIMQTDACSDPIMAVAGGYFCGSNTANNVSIWRSNCWGTFSCTDTNSDWWSRGRGEYDFLMEVAG